VTFVSWDELSEDAARARSGRAGDTGEVYDRRWALALLQRALTRLSNEFETAARRGQFASLKKFLSCEASCRRLSTQWRPRPA